MVSLPFRLASDHSTLSNRVFGRDLSPVNPPKDGKTKKEPVVESAEGSDAGAALVGEEAAVVVGAEDEESAMNA